MLPRMVSGQACESQLPSVHKPYTRRRRRLPPVQLIHQKHRKTGDISQRHPMINKIGAASNNCLVVIVGASSSIMVASTRTVISVVTARQPLMSYQVHANQNLTKLMRLVPFVDARSDASQSIGKDTAHWCYTNTPRSCVADTHELITNFSHLEVQKGHN